MLHTFVVASKVSYVTVRRVSICCVLACSESSCTDCRLKRQVHDALGFRSFVSRKEPVRGVIDRLS